MTKSLYLLWFLCAGCSFTFLNAQVHDRLLAFGFKNQPAALRPLTGGRWLAVGRGEVAPGETFSDTIFAVIFNAAGEVLLKQRVTLPDAEAHQVDDAVGTPDGGFAMAVLSGGCDGGPAIVALQRFDAAGLLVWSTESMNTDLPQTLAIAPDGQLLGVRYNKVYKFDLAMGALLWKASLSDALYHFVLRPGTEDIIGTSLSDIQIWEQQWWSGMPDYSLSYSEDLPDVFTKIVSVPNGNYYACDGSKVFHFTDAGAPANQLVSFTYQVDIQDIALTSNSLFLLCQSDSSSYLLKTDLNGQNMDTVKTYGYWHSGYQLAVKQDTVLVVGTSGSGDPAYKGWWERYNASHLWLHSRVGMADSTVAVSNAAVTAVQQETPLNIVTHPTPTYTYYDFTGGGFKVEVTNTGPDLLDQLDVMTSYIWSNISFCNLRPARLRHYDNLALPPGASVWLDFGDLTGKLQTEIPTQLCFWTAAPNGQSDADRSDDTFCQTVTVGTAEPVSLPLLQADPNPADAGFWVKSPTATAMLQLFNATGQLVTTLSLATPISKTFIETTGLPPGLYTLRAGNHWSKVVVQH